MVAGIIRGLCCTGTASLFPVELCHADLAVGDLTVLRLELCSCCPVLLTTRLVSFNEIRTALMLLVYSLSILQRTTSKSVLAVLPWFASQVGCCMLFGRGWKKDGEGGLAAQHF